MIERRKRGSHKKMTNKPKWKTDQMKRYGFSVKGTSISKIFNKLKKQSKQSLILI